MLILLLTTINAWAVDYTYTTIQVPGSLLTTANGISNRGEIVGNYVDAHSSNFGFVLSNGTYTTISYPGATRGTFAYGINDNGVVVGSYDNGVITGGFSYANGKYVSIQYQSYGTVCEGVNDAGQVVGYYTSNNIEHGFLWQNGTFHAIDVPSATQTVPYGINKNGDISGTYYDSAGQHGFLLKNGVYHTINVPDSNNTTNAKALNDRDWVVGFYTDPSLNYNEGFLSNGKQFQELIGPGAITTYLADVNDSGAIVGVYYNGGTNPVAFMATPQ
jgi:probable HAF family extracellular repeat protein